MTSSASRGESGQLAPRLGARAAGGAGYYAIELGGAPGRRPEAVLFVIADADGALSRDPWSYGRPVPVADPSGGRVLAGPFRPDEPSLSPGERALLRAYLRTLA